MKKIRLDRFLSEMGVDTRAALKELIRGGQVTVNGKTVKKPESRVDAENDAVTVRGERVTYEEFQYFMLNKPQGVVTATRDRCQKTVLDLLLERRRPDISPVGRLDKDTEGLLLLTNDGVLSHRLLAPGRHVPKEYFTVVDGRLGSADQHAFQTGVDIGDGSPTMPAELFILETGEISRAIVTIQEGRYHQIKRMFEALDKRVTFLKRLSMGPLKLDENLKPGQYRRLTESEVSELMKLKNTRER